MFEKNSKKQISAVLSSVFEEGWQLSKKKDAKLNYSVVPTARADAQKSHLKDALKGNFKISPPIFRRITKSARVRICIIRALSFVQEFFQKVFRNLLIQNL